MFQLLKFINPFFIIKAVMKYGAYITLAIDTAKYAHDQAVERGLYTPTDTETK
jgi:hypothetical protein